MVNANDFRFKLDTRTAHRKSSTKDLLLSVCDDERLITDDDASVCTSDFLDTQFRRASRAQARYLAAVGSLLMCDSWKMVHDDEWKSV